MHGDANERVDKRHLPTYGRGLLQLLLVHLSSSHSKEEFVFLGVPLL